MALYVHIPFCRARCTYCDFNTYAGLGHLQADYVRALIKHITAVGQELTTPQGRWPAATLYLGGGTPTVLPVEALGAIVAACRSVFDLAPGADDAPACSLVLPVMYSAEPHAGVSEVSCEANPGTVDLGYLQALRSAGVNRLSLGAQSFDEAELRLLGRIHTADDVYQAVRDARAAGFEELNLDLIYGLPGQTLPGWREALVRAIDLAPAHLSCYALSVEEGTALHDRIRRGILPPPDPDLAADMYELTQAMLREAGFLHYEISNWALDRSPPPVCRHNLVYWRNEPYLGFGAGAHSWFDGRRFANLRLPQDYIRAVDDASARGSALEAAQAMAKQADASQAGRHPVAESEVIGLPLEMAETVILGLRLVEEGVEKARFQARFGCSIESVYGTELAELQALGLVQVDVQRVRLTNRGLLLSNEVFQRLLPDEVAQLL